MIIELQKHRQKLLNAMDHLSDGSMSVNVAAATAAISDQYIKSIEQEFQIRVFCAERNISHNQYLLEDYQND